MAKTAIILGASGATGNEVLKLLLEDSRYNSIKLFSRSSIDNPHPKIKEFTVDLFDLEKHQANFIADEVYCCIGTTKAKTPDLETYHKIDYGIPLAAAKLAKQNNIPVFAVISAIRADPKSSIFYSRTKGEMQEAIMSLKIPTTYILQPSLIIAERPDGRLGEKISAAIMKLFNPLFIGSMEKYRSIKAVTIAKAMVWLCNNHYPEVIVKSDELAKLGK